MTERGNIQNVDRRRQILDCDGLQFPSAIRRYANITPTDLDLFIEYNGRCFILAEIKYKGKEVGYGQRIAFETACRCLCNPAIFIIADHEIYDPDQNVNAAHTKVRCFYANEKCEGIEQRLTWVEEQGSVSLVKYCASFLRRYGGMQSDLKKTTNEVVNQ